MRKGLYATPKLSVIVPFYNEEDSIGPMHDAIVAAVEPLGISLRNGVRRRWQQGRHASRGEEHGAARSARAGRQVPPQYRSNAGHGGRASSTRAARFWSPWMAICRTTRQISSNFLAKMDEGYDIVVGWRFKRQDKMVSRKIPSKIANWLIGKVTGVPIKDNGCSLKAYRASVIKHIPLYSEMHRFIPAMASIAGPRIAEIKVRHHARQFGKSKYGLSRVYKVLLDLMVIKTVASFTSRPLLWFSLLSLPLMLIGTVALIAGLLTAMPGNGGMSLPIAGTGIIFSDLGADADRQRRARRIGLSNRRCAPRALRAPHHEIFKASGKDP